MSIRSKSSSQNIIILILGSIIICAAIVLFALTGINYADSTADAEGISIAEKSIRKAAISCYAIEGSYPPNYQYIKKNYGVRVNENIYYIHYSIFSSNIMPDISVCKIER